MRSAPLQLALRLSAAALIGAAGLGGESLLMTAVGLVVGQARAAAFGLAVWIAAWALGASLAGRSSVAPRRGLMLFGLGAALSAPATLGVALTLAGSNLGGLASLLVGIGLLAVAGFAQGGFLPLLARAGSASDVPWLFTANLLGSVIGARLLGFDLPAALGFRSTSYALGALALVAAGLGWLGSPGFAAQTSPGGPRVRDLRAGIVVGLITAWLAGIEWIGFRLGALWLGGMQPAVTAVLTASLLALAAGAAILPLVLPRDARAVPITLLLAALGALVLVGADLPARVEDPRANPLVTALWLVAPPLLPLGAIVPLLHRQLEGESGARLAGLLRHEAWGALLGVPLVHLLLVPTLGAGGATGALVLLAVPALCLLPGTPRLRRVGVAGCLACALAAVFTEEPALRTPALDRPEFKLIAFREDAHYAVSVIEDGLRGERTLLTDDFRATAVGDDYLYMQVLGHLPLLLHPEPKHVAVLAFGTGTTAGAVAKHGEVTRIDVLELSADVLDLAEHFAAVNGGVLKDARTTVRLGDGRRTLGAYEGELDVLTMEPLLPDSPFAVHLYTPGFYARAKRALAPGGLLCQWVPPQALEPVTFDAIVGAFTGSFTHAAVFLFGTQVILIGGEAPIGLDPARFGISAGTLRDSLAALGLEDPAGAAARFVTTGASWPAVERPLRDADPWVIYRPRRRGTALLADLPTNLATLRRAEEDLPVAWGMVIGGAGRARLAEVRLLHRAREAWHRSEFELRFENLHVHLRPPPLPEAPALGHLEAYRTQLASSTDPEVALLGREIEFVRSYRLGVDALQRRDAQGALVAFGVARKLRPFAADVHLHASLAAAMAGELGLAQRLAEEAYERCPRLLVTPQGQRVISLGLPLSLRRTP